MKKILFYFSLFFFGLIFSNAHLFAQKPIKGDFLTEVAVFFGSSFLQPSIQNPVNPYGFGTKVRYLLKDKLYLRLGFSAQTSNTKYTPENDGKGNYYENKFKSSNIIIIPGVEYHFKGGKNISPYIGISPTISTSSSSQETSYYTNYEFSNQTISTNKFLSYGLQISSGIDIYIYEGLFIGLEINGNMFYSPKNTTKLENNNPKFPQYNTVRESSSGPNFSLGGGNVSGIRFGYKF